MKCKCDNSWLVCAECGGVIDVAQRWIPVSERLPETNRLVLILTRLGTQFTAGHYPDGNWYTPTDEIWGEVTHWMPLPPPPEVDDERTEK